jgi:hypothetical protein
MTTTVRRRSLAIALASGVLFAGAIAGCSSSSSKASGSSTTTAAGASATAAADSAADCPFTGVTTPSSGGTTASATVSLIDVKTSKQGCADNLQFQLSAATSWKFAYATGPILDFTGAPVPTSSPQNLVLTLTNAEWSGAGSTPIKLAAGGLDYVTSINVIEGPSKTTLVVMGLNEQVQYVASDSKAPAYVSLGLG